MMQRDDMLDSRYSWLRLGVSFLIASIGSVGIWSFIAILPAVQAEFGADRGDASLPYVASMLGFALGNVVMGRAIDRWGAAATLAGSALLLAGSYAAAASAPTLIILTALHLAIGLGAAAGFGPLIADVSHWFMRRRGVAVTIAASGNYVAGAFWPWALSGLLAEDGWRAVYYTLAVAVVAAVLPLSVLLRRRAPEAAMSAAAARASAAVMTAGLSPRTLQWLLMFAGVACCVAMSMPQVHIVAYCVDLGYGPAVGTEMLSLMLLGGVASRILSGLVADWLGGVKTLLIGSGLQGLALLLYLPWDGLVPLYVVSTIFGLSQGGIVPCYAIIVREYMPPAEAGRRVGVVVMATVVGMALGGWMSGWIYDLTGSYAMAFLNGIAWNALNFAVILTLMFRSRPRRGAPVAAAA